jgi:hypothetical protein
LWSSLMSPHGLIGSVVIGVDQRAERRMVRVEVLTGSTLGGVGLVATGVLATVLKIYLG